MIADDLEKRSYHEMGAPFLIQIVPVLEELPEPEN